MRQRKRNPGETITIEYATFGGSLRKPVFYGEARVTGVVEKYSRNVRKGTEQVTLVVTHAAPAPGDRNQGAILPRPGDRVTKRSFALIAGHPEIAEKIKGPLAWAHEFIRVVEAGDQSANLFTDWSQRSESTYVSYKGYKFRFSDHALPEHYARPDWDIASMRGARDAARWALAAPPRDSRAPNRRRTPNSKLQTPNSFTSDYRRQLAHIRHDPGLRTASMRRHLRAVGRKPGRAGRRGSARNEWVEFAGYEPNHAVRLSGVALSGELPGVRVDLIEGYGAKTRRKVKITASQTELWLVWFAGGERFALTGGPSAMRELAADFAKLSEPVILTKVDYVAPRYPVPEGVKRSRANADMAVAFTHAVENPTVLTWNGQRDPKRARFDIRVKGRRKRWVNRSGLIF